MANDFFQLIPTLIVALIAFLIFLIAGRLIRITIKKIMHEHNYYNIALVLARLANWFFILLGLFIALAIIFPSITLVDLLAGLGIGSLVLGLAFKNILQNYLAGILILLKKPFKISDEIKYKEFEGLVEFINTRTTFLKSYDGRRIIIPNGEIYMNAIIVNTAYNYRCTEYDIGIGISDDLGKAAEIIFNILQNNKEILKNPQPEVLVVKLDSYTNNLRARWWTTPYQIEILRIQSEVLKAIKQQLYEAGIDIPFPTQVVLWHDQTERADGNRSTQREGWPPEKK